MKRLLSFLIVSYDTHIKILKHNSKVDIREYTRDNYLNHGICHFTLSMVHKNVIDICTNELSIISKLGKEYGNGIIYWCPTIMLHNGTRDQLIDCLQQRLDILLQIQQKLTSDENK